MAEHTKRCSRCGEEKPISEFSRHRSRPDGYSVWCLDCYRETRNRFVSLDVPEGKNISRHDRITRPLPTRTDESWERVCLAMRYWMEDRTLKPAQVAVLMMRSVELLDWPEIAELAGMSRDTVRYHYMQGIRRLRERYRGMMA